MNPVRDSPEKQNSAGTLQTPSREGCSPKSHPFAELQTAEVQYYIILDFEAVCDEQDGKKVRYDPSQGNPQEIIEISSSFFCRAEGRIMKTFYEYIKPQVNPSLSSFCTKLTGIPQETIDKADHFAQVMTRLGSWYEANKPAGRVEVVTFGRWPLKSLLKGQADFFAVPLPQFLKNAIEHDLFVDLRAAWELNTGTQPGNIGHMLVLMNSPPPEVLAISKALNFAMSRTFQLPTLAEMREKSEGKLTTTV